MADFDVPADVQRFLHEYFESLEQLEILVLLQRRPEHAWSTLEVAEGLRVRDSVAEEELRRLCDRGLLVSTASTSSTRYRYGPISPTLDGMTQRLLENYGAQRVSIMRLMTANAIQRMRAGALGVFSNAFVFRKREKPDG
jgi:predicted transcriptional regulator